MNRKSHLYHWIHAKETIGLGRRSNGKAWRIFLAQGLLYIGCVLGASVHSSWFLNLLFSLFAGFSIGQLFVIGHDACHQSLAESRWVNHLIGRLCFLPSLHAYSLWRLEHNIKHHQHTNIKRLDPSWSPLSPHEFRQLSWHRQVRERIYRSAWGGGAYYLLEMWCRNHVLPLQPDARRCWGKYLPDSLSILSFILFLPVLLFSWRSWVAPDRPLWEVFVLAWLIPFLVWNWMMGLVIYLHHTHPKIAWFAEAPSGDPVGQQFQVTAHVIFPWPIPWLLYSIMAHNAHHIRPNIPLYNLRQAQENLQASVPEEALVYHWTPALHRAIARTCKLYDYQRMCWTDFNGVPTTMPRNG